MMRAYTARLESKIGRKIIRGGYIHSKICIVEKNGAKRSPNAREKRHGEKYASAENNFKNSLEKFYF